MGRMSLLVVASIIIFSSMTFMSIQNTNQRSVESNSKYALKSESHSNAENLVEQLVQDYIRTGVTDKLVKNFGDPSQEIYGEMELIEGGDQDTIKVVARDSTYSEDYTVVEKAFVIGREAGPPPLDQASPLGLAGPLGISLVNGSVDFNGWNRGIPNTDGVPAITVQDQEDAEQIRNTIDNAGSSRLIGPQDVAVDNTFEYEDLNGLSTLLQKNADSSIPEFNAGNQVWGTEDNPQITYRDGDLRANGNVNGCGILAVNGSIDVRGAFEWNGLVLMIGEEENNDITLSAKGAPAINGSLLATTPDEGDLNIDTRGAVSLTRFPEYLQIAQDLIDDANNGGNEKEIVSIDWSSGEDYDRNSD